MANARRLPTVAWPGGLAAAVACGGSVPASPVTPSPAPAPLRSQLYARGTRVGSDPDGRHDYDVAGRLGGNWFLEGTPEEGSLLPEDWPMQLAFACSNTHPDLILIPVAGTLALTSLFAVQDGAPEPANVSATSGPGGSSAVQVEGNTRRRKNEGGKKRSSQCEVQFPTKTCVDILEISTPRWVSVNQPMFQLSVLAL